MVVKVNKNTTQCKHYSLSSRKSEETKLPIDKVPSTESSALQSRKITEVTAASWMWKNYTEQVPKLAIDFCSEFRN